MRRLGTRTEKVRFIRLRTDEVYGGVIAEREKETTALQELAASIAMRGLLQPIVVRRCVVSGRYALVCGTRRLAACRLLGWKEIDAMLIEADGQEGAACFLEEHLLKERLCATQEVQALKMTKDDMLCEGVGLMRHTGQIRSVARLETETKNIIHRYGISREQAQAIAVIRDPVWQVEAAMITAQRGLTPEQIRRLAAFMPKNQSGEDAGKRRNTKAALSEIYALARRMRAQGAEVSVAVHSQEGGMCIQFLMKNGEKVNNQQENRRK